MLLFSFVDFFPKFRSFQEKKAWSSSLHARKPNCLMKPNVLTSLASIISSLRIFDYCSRFYGAISNVSPHASDHMSPQYPDPVLLCKRTCPDSYTVSSTYQTTLLWLHLWHPAPSFSTRDNLSPVDFPLQKASVLVYSSIFLPFGNQCYVIIKYVQKFRNKNVQMVSS